MQHRGSRVLFTTALLAALLPAPLLADGHAEGENGAIDEARALAGRALGGWSGAAGIGATSSTGAAESSNINASIRLNKAYERWEHLLFGSVFKGSSTVVITETDDEGNIVTNDAGQPIRRIVKGDNSDRIALGYQPKYFFSERTYAFGLLDYETDEPANIDSAFRQIIGIGHRFYENDSGFFSGEVGFGNKNTSPVTGDDIDGGIGYLGLNYLNRITENFSLNADLRSDFGSDNTFVEIGLGLTAKLSDRLNARLSHFTRSNSDLDSGDNPLDSGSSGITTFNLVFDI